MEHFVVIYRVVEVVVVLPSNTGELFILCKVLGYHCHRNKLFIFPLVRSFYLLFYITEKDSNTATGRTLPLDASQHLYVNNKLSGNGYSCSSFRFSSSNHDTIDSPRRTLSVAENALEKSGYLTKLGGKIKSWRKRYFVLKNETLSYWKSHHDCHRKPQGIIAINESCRVSRAEAVNTFEIALRTESGAGSAKTYYFRSDSTPLMEEWVSVLQNIIQKNALKLLLSREDQKPTLCGWLTKVKHGHAKHCWCVLIGKMFLYFKMPSDQVSSDKDV